MFLEERVPKGLESGEWLHNGGGGHSGSGG